MVISRYYSLHHSHMDEYETKDYERDYDAELKDLE